MQNDVHCLFFNNYFIMIENKKSETFQLHFLVVFYSSTSLFLNASQIGAKLAEKAKINLNDGTINKIGKALKKHNFVKLMRKGSPVYALKEFSYEEVDEANKKIEK